MLPYGIVNGFLALTGNERRMGFWAVPYVGWGGSIVGLTLLSALANLLTGVVNAGAVGAGLWAVITLIEGAVTAAGIVSARRSYGKQLIHAQALQETDEDASDTSSSAYLYWLLWLGGVLAFNWIVDMIYALSVGAQVQGIGPGWIDLVEILF